MPHGLMCVVFCPDHAPLAQVFPVVLRVRELRLHYRSSRSSQGLVDFSIRSDGTKIPSRRSHQKSGYGTSQAP